MEAHVSDLDACLIRAADGASARLAVPLLDAYLEFVAGHCAANTVLTTAFDLKVFIGFVGKPPGEVTAADVLGFITAQRTGAASAGLHA
jgi:integrase/recombinase XerD